MNAKRTFLALDLGAESGRAVVGGLDSGHLTISEIHRFPNGPVRVGDHLHWDVLRLWSEIQVGLNRAYQAHGSHLTSLGLDTWGVDFGLLDAEDNLISNPYHYRDRQTDGMLQTAFQRVPKVEIYAQTGLQFMQQNSLYQLLAMLSSPTLEAAQTFLNMPDLFNFWLCGRKASEFTIATTTQCYNPIQGNWAVELLDKLGIPSRIFQPIVAPGVILESLRPSVAEEVSCASLPVVAVGSHDTASAVAAVPSTQTDFIYLSSGTWSLMGVEIERPIITPQSMAYNFTNEGGLNGKFRFLKNIIGLWLLQECRREWARHGQAYSYDELVALAEAAPAFEALIVPGDPCFLPPGDMPARAQLYCQRTGQAVPQSHGAISRCIMESLALEYRRVADCLEELLGRPLPVIHIIGGGSRNRLLNQFTADATCKTVVAGPVEATAIGNLLAQAMALGDIDSLDEGREVVCNSFTPEIFEPRYPEPWDEAYQQYLTCLGRL
jgi:rhamnulokinase